MNQIFNLMSKLFNKIGGFLKKLTGQAFSFLRQNAGIAVHVTGALKNIVESPLTGSLFDLLKIPGNPDDKALEALKKVLPGVAMKTSIMFNILGEHDTNADAVSAAVTYLKQQNPDARAAFWLVFSAELNKALSDGELSLAEAAALAQMVYAERKGA